MEPSFCSGTMSSFLVNRIAVVLPLSQKKKKKVLLCSTQIVFYSSVCEQLKQKTHSAGNKLTNNNEWVIFLQGCFLGE